MADRPAKSGESSSARIEEFCRQAGLPISDFPAFEIELGGFNSFLDMPFLDVHDDGWCFRIHHRLRDFVAGALDDTYAYLPYVPLGYYTQATEMGPFPAKMAPWLDRKKLLPGQVWTRCIDRAIENSDFFVACFSTVSAVVRASAVAVL